jgi:hypothetical protein
VIRLLVPALALGALLGCEEKTRPPLAPSTPWSGVPRIGGGGERGRDGGVRPDAPLRDAAADLPRWCAPIPGSSPDPEVIELAEVERAIEFTPDRVTAKWSALFCKPDGRRFLRISLVDDAECDLWSVADPVQELFLYVDVDAIRADELAPRMQPVGIDDDRVQVFYGQGPTLWGLCDALAGGSVDFVDIGADDDSRISLVLTVDLSDCAAEPLAFPLRIEAEIETTLQHSEAEACATF